MLQSPKNNTHKRTCLSSENIKIRKMLTLLHVILLNISIYMVFEILALSVQKLQHWFWKWPYTYKHVKHPNIDYTPLCLTGLFIDLYIHKFLLKLILQGKSQWSYMIIILCDIQEITINDQNDIKPINITWYYIHPWKLLLLKNPVRWSPIGQKKGLKCPPLVCW